MRAPIVILAWLAALSGAAGAPDLTAKLDRLVAAYPDFLGGHDGQWLTLKDGRRFAISDGRGAKRSRRGPAMRGAHASANSG